MYALLALIWHVVIGSLAALAIAPFSNSLGATFMSMWMLALASAAISTIGLAATATYLSRRLRRVSGGVIGVLSGLLCGIITGLVVRGIDYSLVLYLAILAPTLLAVLLATLLDRPTSGWQT